MEIHGHTHFAPQLYIKPGVKDISFYERAFGAKILRTWLNDDDTLHVAELAINGAMFHVHEDSPAKRAINPESAKVVTTLIGLFVPDVKAFTEKALANGAVEIFPVTDYDYGYRQSEIKDPFGHHWQIQQKI